MRAGGLRSPLFRLACLALALPCSAVAVAEDSGPGRERRLADVLLERLESGAPVWLETGGYTFLGLHTPSYGRLPRRAVLLVHGMGGHPDWPEVIAPLRGRLPAHGWGTLSLQMPLLPTRALAEDYGGTLPAAQARIAAGIAFLRDQGYSRIVLAGYGFGAVAALAYQAGSGGADGVISISGLAREFLQPVPDLPDLMAKVEVPLLDVYAGNDLPEILRKAERRRTAAAAGPDDFEQRMIAGADHYYTGRDTQLVETVLAWLNRRFGDGGG